METSKVDWRAITRQSLFFTGIQHAYRLGTEPGTREGMKGPFFRGYADSVANLHGWGDGDPFMVNYVGHPLQGAVSGFIYVQNDTLARRLRIGRDRRYWRSRLKATGVAFGYSSWFEIGPVSEASIGKVQRSRPQQGFVDHVITPIVGTGWLLAEDFVDEKLVLPFERKFQNPYARMMVRGWLNPSRSFANMLAFKAPWYRYTRGGVFAKNYAPPVELRREAERRFSRAATFEVSAMTSFTQFDGVGCAGGGGQGAFRLAPHWQLVGEVHGCQLRALASHRSGDSLTYVIGPRWTPLADHRFSPFAQVLFGGNKLTRYEEDPVRKALLTVAAKEPPAAELYTKQETQHGIALLAGSGVDVRLNPALALRLASVEYSHNWTPPLDGRGYNQGLQLSTGIILRMGSW